MECPNCTRNETEELKELSRGMGNQSFQDCPVCGTFAIVSGEVVTQYWRHGTGAKEGVTENAIRTVR